MHTVVPWFTLPAPSFLVQLAQQNPVLEYGPGECLLHAHAVNEHCFVVEEGLCQRQLRNTVLGSIGFIGPGAAFGELGCITPVSIPSDITALTSVRLRAVSCEALMAHIGKNGEITTSFLRYVMEKYNQIWRIVTLLLDFSVRERFLYFLNACIAPQAALEWLVYYPLRPDLNQTQIADMLAVNRISLAKVIRPLREKGRIKVHKSSLSVHRDCLEELAFLRGKLLPPSVIS